MSETNHGFAVEYKGRPVGKEWDCYNCEYCRRLRYLKSEWHCRILKPHELPENCTCFVRRSPGPNCMECENWNISDPRCMEPRSQWAGLITSPDNYCRFFERKYIAMDKDQLTEGENHEQKAKA